MRVGDVFIEGIGIYLPERKNAATAVDEGVYSAEDFAANEIDEVPIAGDMAPVDMAVHAVRHAFDRSGADPADVSFVLYATGFHQGPNGWSPASYIQRNTIGGSAPAVELRGHCTGLFSAVQLAVGQLRAAPENASVLVVGSDNFSGPLVDRWSHLNGMVLGDAAVAVLLSKRPGFARLRSVGVQAVPQLEELHRSGVPIWPPTDLSAQTMDLRARSVHFVEHSPLAKELKDLLVNGQQELNDRTVADAGLGSMSEISWIGHINASRAVVAERLLPLFGFTEERSTYRLGRDLGHVGTGDQVICFDRLIEQQLIKPGETYLMAGVGPGLQFGTAVLEYLSAPPWSA
ncbi:ketoacyl-ACP synthase III family protein [Kitasatospora sp. NPDC085464]|uniref:ketoacyl-ACP synthase III family protein n=1 Tax=Kitasatospora sp. NPDC085464 TaxID=3364063 RepID=UPI0037C950D4